MKILQKTLCCLLATILFFSATLLTACNASNNANNNGEHVQPVPTPTPSVPESPKPQPTPPEQPVEPPVPTPPPQPESPKPQPTPPEPPVEPPVPTPPPQPEPPNPQPPTPPQPVEPNPEPTLPEQPEQPSPEKPKPAQFAYQAKVRQKMPTIHITTPDGSNAFAMEERNYYPGNGYEYVKQEFAYKDCSISIRNAETEYNFENKTAQIKPRGNSTVMYPKKPFRLKFTEKQGMLGLNNGLQAKSWVLLADWKDASLLRNNTALYLGKLFYESVGLYTSDFCTVELYLNGQYWGVYLLCEQTQVGKNRVNINEPVKGYTGTDIGYLIELDAYSKFENELNRFTLNYNNNAWLNHEDGSTISFTTKTYTIKSDIYSAAQRDFIANYLENIYRICYNAIMNNKYYKFNESKTDIVPSNDTNAKDAIARVVDIDSVVASYILEEIVCNLDLAESSFYMSIDLSPTGDGRLRFQAAWDFDSALGNIDWINNKSDKIFAANSDNYWLVMFYKADWFKAAIKEMWQVAKEHNIEERVLQYINECISTYADAYAQNYKKWENIGSNIEKNYNKAKALALDTEKRTQAIYNAYLSLGDLLNIVPDAGINCATQADAGRYLHNWLKYRFGIVDKIFLK